MEKVPVSGGEIEGRKMTAVAVGDTAAFYIQTLEEGEGTDNLEDL